MKKKWLLWCLTAVLLAGSTLMLSCSSKSSDSSVTPEQAAASSSAAMGAVSLSNTIGMSTDIAAGAIPAQYAPAIAGSGPVLSTSDIAKIDPRLKEVVDKMVGVLQKAGTTGAAASQTAALKANSLRAISSAPSATTTITGAACAASGTFDITVSFSTAGTATTWNLDAAFHDCKDNIGNDVVNGTLTATHTKDTAAASETASVNANLTDTTFDMNSNVTGTFALNGVFEGIDNGQSGTNSAGGSFTWTIPGNTGNTVMAFTFGSASNPVVDAWSRTSDATGTTETHTGNGSYGLSITSPTASLSLDVTLTGMEDKVLTYAMGGDEDEWVNGAVTITWNPDLSQWGCRAGTYTFTTAANTPIHTPFGAACPTSGTVQVNNAMIEFGSPSGSQVTVTVGTLSHTFINCNALGNGLCR